MLLIYCTTLSTKQDNNDWNIASGYRPICGNRYRTRCLTTDIHFCFRRSRELFIGNALRQADNTILRCTKPSNGIDVVKIGCDFLSVSSHKIHGCKGIGALYAKDKSKLTPIVYGGSEQEFGLRGGTENVAGIVGFGKACEISSKSLHEDTVWVSTLKQRFFMALNEALKDTGDESCVHVNGMSILTPGKTINLRMDGVDGETLLLMLDGKGVCVSAGSACRSHEAEPSHVLSAMGLSKDEARSSIRISFSKKNTADEAVRAAQILAGCISALRAREEKE